MIAITRTVQVPHRGTIVPLTSSEPINERITWNQMVPSLGEQRLYIHIQYIRHDLSLSLIMSYGSPYHQPLNVRSTCNTVILYSYGVIRINMLPKTTKKQQQQQQKRQKKIIQRGVITITI